MDVTSPVIFTHQLLEIIKERKKSHFSIDQVNYLADQIITAVRNNKITRMEHIKQIKSNIQEREQMEKALICPRCGNDLVLRNGKYGKFYGCSNYPYCRYTLGIGD